VDGHATFSRFFDPRILNDDPETTDNRDFDLVGDEYRFPFPPDAVGILYLVATLYSWVNWIDGDGNIDCRVCGGGIGFVGGTKVNSHIWQRGLKVWLVTKEWPWNFY